MTAATRDRTALGRALAAVRRATPPATRWTVRAVNSLRRLVMYLAAFAGLTWAALLVYIPAGVAVGSILLIVLDYLITPPPEA